MADNLTTYLENALLAHSVGKTAYTAPTNTYLALFTVAPTDSTAGTEVSGGNYARIKMTWGSPSEGSIATSADARFPASGNASVDWGTIVAVGILDASTSGNILWYGGIAPSITLNSGDNYTFVSGGITLTLS